MLVPQPVSLEKFRNERGMKMLSLREILDAQAMEGWRKQQFLKTLLAFRRRLNKEQSHSLMRQLSLYARSAKFFGQNPDEFYFDGRFPGGCGFNGGIIYRENDEHGFSTHT
jgi:hypothetical protein